MDGWDKLLQLCMKTDDKKLLSSMFDFFLTLEEKANLSMRIMLIKELLLAEKPQREIASCLNISIAKITRGSNELKKINPKLLKYLKNILMK